MGTAIIRGMAGDSNIELLGFDLNQKALADLEIECGLVAQKSPCELALKSDFVVLAVKPQHAGAVLEEIAPNLNNKKCLVSIAAGLTIERLKEFTESRCPVVRVMPNTPALVNAGVFAVCTEDTHLSAEQKDFAGKMFKPLGDVHLLAESQFDAFTGLIGSGPAYVFYFMEALMESGVELGLTRAQSSNMVKKLFEGSAKLSIESEKHISELREMVTSPAGTTVEGLIHMDRTAIRANIVDAVKKSYERSIQLGKQ